MVKIKGPQRTLAYLKLDLPEGGRSKIKLVSGAEVFLPNKFFDCQIDNNGQKIVIIPKWLFNKLQKQLIKKRSNQKPHSRA